MADFRSTPLQVCAVANGGADVDVSATLFVDGRTSQEGDQTIVDAHLERQCVELTGRKVSGKAQLRLIFVVVPLVGNGQFEVAIELTHSDIPGSPRSFKKRGNAAGAPKTFSMTLNLA
ncbi:hypothetical protein [Methylibium rhizosphaerae]|uniref:hypothetical protein n=1 Tax=Methylibium rhizosphaerae TaxID=2570323 RepID=UPI00112751D9|nr:hypothetical protein [Methylibium rhizosphaerae]